MRAHAAALAVVQVSRVVRILEFTLGLALALLLAGVVAELLARRRAGAPSTLGPALRPHALSLLVLTASGALLRVAGGSRVPGFEGARGEGLGFADVAARLGEPPPGLDPHGSGPAALAQLVFSVLPRTEGVWIGLQATLAVLTIPLVYLGALAWLRNKREATWAAAVYALLPSAAYFAMTEVRPVAGAFFLMLAVVLAGLAVSARRALWLASAGLFAVLATSFHPVLAPAPLVLGLLLVAREDGYGFLETPPGLLAVAGIVLTWVILLQLLWIQMAGGGEGLATLPHMTRVLLPTFGAAPAEPFNAFLNTHSTPPVITLLWVIGLAALGLPSHRRVVLTLALAGLVMTLPGMSGGRLALARLQYAATPLHAMLAGVGVVALLELLTRKLASKQVRHALPAGLAIALGLSVAAFPGPLSGAFVYESERQVVLRAQPDLGAECDVWVAPTEEGAYGGAPTYLTAPALPASRWHGLARIDETHARVAASLARDGCAYYYRPSACWAQLRHEAPAQPDPTALRTECAATEARLQLEPLHVETILAVPASAASYRRPQIEVGFFRIRALAL